MKVILSRRANRDLRKVPNYIIEQFDLWVEIIEEEGIFTMRSIPGYRDHALKGDRNGQRSSSLSRSWRVIYEIDEKERPIVIKVLEVNNHDY